MEVQDLYNCWECDSLFDRQGASWLVCDTCRTNERIKKAEGAIGKRISVCYAHPVSGAAMFSDGIVKEHIGEGYVTILLEDGELITTSDYQIYIDQPKGTQLNLF